MKCDHTCLKTLDGYICIQCGETFKERPIDWNGPGPAVRGDLKPHFNWSAGQPIESRAHLAEVCKREGLRPVDPSLASEDRAWDECDRLKKGNEKKIANPRKPLRHYYEEQIRNA